MSETAPTVYLLHGNDEFAMREFVQSLEGKVNDDRAMALMDIVKVDGRTIGEDELRSAAYTIPFLNLRRLVVLTSPTARVDGKDKASRQRFLDLLSDLPSSTALVLVLDDQLERGRWKERARNQWLFDWAANAGGQCLQKDFTLPVSGEMAGWLVREARKMGGEISPPAANLLASHTGSDTRRAMLELEKLLIYVDYQRKVESDDVKALAIPDEQVNVFQLVDAMTAAEGSAALASLHKLLDDEEPLMIFGMVTRQFRLLLLARAVIDAGGGRDQILKQIGDVRSDFVAGKIYNQVRHWSAPTLEAIYRRLFEIDRDVKTGQVAVEVALDQLVVEVCTGVRG